MKIVQLRKRHIRTLNELCRMAARHFDEEMAEEADALQKHIAKQLSDDGPHAKLLDVMEAALGVKPSGPCKCTCGRHEGH